MRLRIGKFNKLPVYLNIPAPLQLIREVLRKEPQRIAFVQPKFLYYDQLQAKHEGSISIIPEKNIPKNKKYTYAIVSVDKIVVEPRFLLLPKINKLFVLWHEYGHTVMLLSDEEGLKSSFHEVYEALADFYACCKLKLHFNTCIKIIYFSFLGCFNSKRKKFFKNAHLAAEERYHLLYASRQMELKERDGRDYIYQFYRDKNVLIDWYMFCFREMCDMDYLNFFDWNEFLVEIGWDNDEERWKYIGYKE